MHQPIARRQHRAVGLQKDVRRSGPAREPRSVERQRIRGVVGDVDAVAGQRNRRRDQLGEREFAGAVFCFRQRQPRDRAGHADGERGFARLLRIGVALRIEEGFGVDRRRRGLAIVDGGVLAACAVDHHETAAADIAGARIGHGHGETGGHRRVDGVAALLQDFNADARGDRFLRDHHAMLGGDRQRRPDLGRLRAGGRWQQESAGKRERRPPQHPAVRWLRGHCAGAGVAAPPVLATRT